MSEQVRNVGGPARIGVRTAIRARESTQRYKQRRTVHIHDNGQRCESDIDWRFMLLIRDEQS